MRSSPWTTPEETLRRSRSSTGISTSKLRSSFAVPALCQGRWHRLSKTVGRVQEVAIPILREALPHAHVSSWVDDIDYRTYPIVNIRRLGGTRDKDHAKWYDHPVIEMTVLGDEGLVETEDLYIDALNALFDAAKHQTMTDKGYITYVRETMGMTQFGSLFEDSWRVQGLIKLGIRPAP